MNTHAPDPLPDFLAAVRRRLWARQVQHHLVRFSWQSGALLVLLATIHQLLTPVSVSVTMAGVTGLFLFTLLRCLQVRPTLAASAAAADREFAGQALMTTALECTREADTAGDEVAKIVLQQASAAARSFAPRVATQFRSPTATLNVLAIVPIFVGTTLLVLSGAEMSGKSSQAIERSAAQIETAALQASGTSADEIAMLRSPTVPAGLPVDDARITSERTVGALQLVANDSPDALAAADPFPLDEAADQSGGVAAPGKDDSDLPGDALPGSELLAGAPSAEAQVLRRELIELKRNGTPLAAGENRNGNFDAAEPAESRPPLDVLAADAPATRSFVTSLTAAQAAYARRYLAGPGISND